MAGKGELYYFSGFRAGEIEYLLSFADSLKRCLSSLELCVVKSNERIVENNEGCFVFVESIYESES